MLPITVPHPVFPFRLILCDNPSPFQAPLPETRVHTAGVRIGRIIVGGEHVKLSRPLFLLPILLAPAFGQSDGLDLVANKPGHAEAKVAGVVLHADEGTLNHETGELKMCGHVHVLLPAREDHTVVRYGAGVLLTDQPIGLTADQVSVKNGLLQASGNIVVVPADPELPKVQLRGDEIYMYLRIADATLRGNVRSINIPEAISFPGLRFARPRIFPPEIIK
jgi:hypothetical protein